MWPFIKKIHLWHFLARSRGEPFGSSQNQILKCKLKGSILEERNLKPRFWTAFIDGYITKRARSHSKSHKKSGGFRPCVCIHGYTTKRARSHFKSHKKSGGFRPCVCIHGYTTKRARSHSESHKKSGGFRLCVCVHSYTTKRARSHFIPRSALDHTLKATKSPEVSNPVCAFMVIPRSALDHTLKATKSPEVSDPVCAFMVIPRSALDHTLKTTKSPGVSDLCMHSWLSRSALDHILKATKSPEVSDPVCINGYTTKRARSHSKSHKKSGGFRSMCAHLWLYYEAC